MRVLLRWLCSWLVLLVIWLAFVGVVAYVEIAAGAIAAALAVTAMEGVRSRGLQDLLPEPGVATRALRVPLDIAVESWTVMRVLGTAAVRRRPPHGRLQSVSFEPPGTSRTSATRAFMAWLDSISPNEYVLEVEDEDGRAATHVLVANSTTRQAS